MQEEQTKCVQSISSTTTRMYTNTVFIICLCNLPWFLKYVKKNLIVGILVRMKNYIDESVWQTLDKKAYKNLYLQSINEPKIFWEEQAKKFLTFEKNFETCFETDLKTGNVQWFLGGKLNVCFNCIDRHLPTKANDTALIFEADNPNESSKNYTFKQCFTRICQISNALKQLGVQKGDRVCLYMPMVPETLWTMLACARIGACHSVVFGGFSSSALKDRIDDAKAKVVVTAQVSNRSGKKVALQSQVDEAIREISCVEKVLVLTNDSDQSFVSDKTYHSFHDVVDSQSTECEPEWMDSEDPLFILYTSGSTGKPKGVVHTQAGYLLGAMMSFRYVFDYQPGQVYWCSADVGWVTGHSYLVYGPLGMGATTLMYEGVPTYPDPSRCWQVIDKHQVNIFYTAPTLIRALMKQGDSYLKTTSRDSLKVLGTVGEPINPKAWLWYKEAVGKNQCPIVDTWWQTETGSIMLAPLIGISNQKPGSAGLPMFGVNPDIYHQDGTSCEPNQKGALVLKSAWPSMMRTIFNDQDRFISTYLSQYEGCYFTGDGATQDEFGEFWVTGRIDDVINVSGHRIGTAEVESALVAHASVAESAVVGIEDEITGQQLVAFVILKSNINQSEKLILDLQQTIVAQIGKFARPKMIMIARDLPKTRSGKIMRRILRKIASGQFNELGDTSTLADQSCVSELIESAKQLHEKSA